MLCGRPDTASPRTVRDGGHRRGRGCGYAFVVCIVLGAGGRAGPEAAPALPRRAARSRPGQQPPPARDEPRRMARPLLVTPSARKAVLERNEDRYVDTSTGDALLFTAGARPRGQLEFHGLSAER